MNDPKLLITAFSFPPYVTPSAVLIDNIFKEYQGKLIAVSGTNFTKTDSTFNPPCPTSYVRLPNGSFAESVALRVHHLLTPYYFRHIEKVVKKQKPDAIITNFPRDAMVVASYQVAQKYNLPFYIYMHDLWEENMLTKARLNHAKKWEPQILKNSTRVICCSDKAQEHYKKKYGIETDLIIHPIPDREIDSFSIPEEQVNKKPNSKFTIAFSGTLAQLMNQDAFVTLSDAMDLLPDNYEFVWLPINKMEKSLLESKGITSNKIVQKLVNREQLKVELRNADVVFSPLSHKNCSIEEVMTVFSNKLLGYLVSGTPILVFGPKGCYHNVLAKDGGWGYVVEEDSPQALAQAIIEMTNPSFDSKGYIKNALVEAEKRRASRQAAKILNWVKEDTSKD